MRRVLLKGDIVSLLAYTLPIIGVLSIISYALTGFFGAYGNWGTVVYGLTTLVFVGGASYIIGGLIGFLFGIPKKNLSDQSSTATYAPNTNLEQISDWFTKIILGIGLVNMKEIGSWIGYISTRIAQPDPNKGLGLVGDPSTFISCLIVFFVCVGFLNGYLATRIILPRVFSQADLEKN